MKILSRIFDFEDTNFGWNEMWGWSTASDGHFHIELHLWWHPAQGWWAESCIGLWRYDIEWRFGFNRRKEPSADDGMSF